MLRVVRFPFFLSLARTRAPSFFCSSNARGRSCSRSFPLCFVPSLPTTPVFFLLAPLSFRSVFLLSSFRYNPTTFGTRFHSFTWVRRTCVRNCNFPRTSLIETFALLAFSNAYPKISGELVALRFFQRRVILRSFAFL